MRPHIVKKAAKDDRLNELPISLRGQNLGAIKLRRGTDQSPWTEEEKELVQDAISQVAPALENARLLEEIQQRAYQESLFAQFATQIQSSLDLESVLRTAVSEIASAMDAPRVRIRLGGEPEKNHQEQVTTEQQNPPLETASTDGNGHEPQDQA